MFLSAVTLKIRSRSQSPNQGFKMSKSCIHANFGQNQVISSENIEHNITFWSKCSVFLSEVTLSIRSRSQSPNQGFRMSECCIHENFGQNQVISSGDIEHNITFWSKCSVFLSAVTLKIRSRPQSHNQGYSISKCCIHASIGQNQVISSGDIEHNITFWSKCSVFLSAVTLKIRSRSQSPNQGFSMSKCCILANVGQNPVIRSGYIVHIYIKGTC